VVVGGVFTTLGGQIRYYIGRLNNSEPAAQSLSYDGSNLVWLRGGTGPEISTTSFEQSPDGLSWVNVGPGARVSGGWQLSNVALTPGATVRARGQVSGSYFNGSGWFVETTLRVGPWLANQGTQGGVQSFLLLGQPGIHYGVYTTTNPQLPLSWSPCYDLTLTNNGQSFGWTNAGEPVRFFRAREE
jgi:hypothetical protein